MRLIKSVPITDSQTMGIYELDAEATEYFSEKYLLSSSLYSSYWLNNHDDITIASKLKKEYYEGLFVTIREAELTTQLIKAICEIERLQSSLNRIHEESRTRPIEIEI